MYLAERPCGAQSDEKEKSSLGLEQEIISSTTDSQTDCITNNPRPRVSFQRLISLPRNHPDVMKALEGSGPLTKLLWMDDSKKCRTPGTDLTHTMFWHF